MHKIISTTDDKYIGKIIDIQTIPIQLDKDTYFYPDFIVKINETCHMVYNSSYIINTIEEI